MQTCDYKKMESYMLSCMQDSAHDSQHIYRVLYIALDIASHEEGVDFDVLIAACLLHDIGRQEEFRDPALCHAAVGAAKAYAFLTTEGWFPAAFAQRVAGCIRAHRFRSGSPPARIEEKILFDADKLDVTGCTGIARSLLYIGQVGTPLYSLDAAGAVSDGSRDEQPSFFLYFHYKLKGLYSLFYTERGRELARERQSAADSFYRSLLQEVSSAYQSGPQDLLRFLQ